MPAAGGFTFAFGTFRFIPFERVLLRADEPLRLGSRAREILLALVERAGILVGKHELIARVWPDVVIDEGALRVHVAALRKTLGDAKTGARYVENVHGLGYRFVAPVTRIGKSGPAPRVRILADTDANALPVPLTRTIGRAQVLATLASRLPDRRFMTIVGPGGIGKSTVAVAAADALRANYAHGVPYIDFGPVSHPELIGIAIASRLGTAVVCDDPVPGMVAHLRGKCMLIVLDNCEHVVRAVAQLTERLLNSLPDIHILATSREPLRARSEWVLRLGPLEFPPTSTAMSASEALGFSAVQLFTERANASLDQFELDDAAAPVVADICRRLDGLPLAIELAAAHVDLFGTQGLLARLDGELGLLTPERRTVVPRHQTLSSSLDWSYDLLSEFERMALCRLCVFVGTFCLEAAQSVVAGDPMDHAQALEAVANLVAKSLVAVEIGRPEMCYRLLNTTRAYALKKLTQSGEQSLVARRHAIYYRDLLERGGAGRATLSDPDAPAGNADHVRNVRAALEWSFAPGGDLDIGTALTAASAP